MTSHAVAHHAAARRPASRRSLARAWQFVSDRFLLLPLGAAIALIWANTASESYFLFAQALAFPVNEIAMALFLALIAQEVLEATMAGGALHTWRRWTLPILAAAGGVLGSAGAYLAYVQASHELVLQSGWPIAIAVDIAAGYYVLKLIAPRSGTLPFLLVLAIATNALALLVLAPYRSDLQPTAVVLVIAAVGIALALRDLNVSGFWPYLGLCGTMSWLGFYWAGFHPALALLPIVPFLPREPRRRDLFAAPRPDDDVHRFEHEWTDVVQGVVFLFGLVNAGVLLRGYDTGTWAVLTAALVGRPVGILLATALGLALGLHLPRRVGWPALVVVALATSSGFTFALFTAAGTLPLGAALTQLKVGALLTAIGALATIVTARALRFGRFAR